MSLGGDIFLFGRVDLAGDTTVNVQVTNSFPTNRLTITGQIAGGGSGLTKIGAGELQLSGTPANIYTGTTTVNDGTLILSKPAGVNAIGGNLIIGNGSGSAAVITGFNNQIPDTAAVTIVGGTLALNNLSETIGSLTMTAGLANSCAGVLTLNGNVTTNASAASAVINGILNRRGHPDFHHCPGFRRQRPSRQRAGHGRSGFRNHQEWRGPNGAHASGPGGALDPGPNSYSGLTLVNSGILEITLGSALGTFANANQGTTVASGATLQLAGGISVSEPLMLNGFGFGNSGALFNRTGNNTWAGPITLAGSTAIGVASTTTLSISGVISGSFGITKLGLGQVRYTGGAANTYTGTTTLNEGALTLAKSPGITAVPGNLVIGDGVGTDTDVVTLLADNQIADSGAVTVNATGRLDLFSSEAIGPLTMNSGMIVTQLTVDPVTGVPKFSTLILTGNVTVNALPTVASPSRHRRRGQLEPGQCHPASTVADTIANPLTPELAISIQITGAAGVGFSKQGAGLMELDAASTYTGPTTLSAGQLSVRNATALGTTVGNTTVQSGAKILFGGTGGTSMLVNEPLVLSGVLKPTPGLQTWSGPITVSGTATVQVNANDTLVLSGSISGTGDLAKLAAGTLEYTGTLANTHSGTTTVNEGLLLLNKPAGVRPSLARW